MMALGHLALGVGVGVLAALALAIAGQPPWRAVLAYSLAGSLTVVTSVLMEIWRRGPAMGGPSRPVPLGPLRADR